MSDKEATENPTEAEDLRLTISELNQSIAYLSKMVLQLQRSINEQKPSRQQPKSPPKKDPPNTIH